MLAATSCSDYFLDLEPTDTQTEANYYQTAAQFEAAANSTYSFYGFKDVKEKVNGVDYTHTIYNTWDNGSDIGGLNDATKGTLAAQQKDEYWGLCYAKIRKCNVVIDKAAAYTGTEDISASVATAIMRVTSLASHSFLNIRNVFTVSATRWGFKKPSRSMSWPNLTLSLSSSTTIK